VGGVCCIFPASINGIHPLPNSFTWQGMGPYSATHVTCILLTPSLNLQFSTMWVTRNHCTIHLLHTNTTLHMHQPLHADVTILQPSQMPLIYTEVCPHLFTLPDSLKRKAEHKMQQGRLTHEVCSKSFQNDWVQCHQWWACWCMWGG
jgi:hypothetical protein